MLKKILLALATIIGLILIIAAFRPSAYHVERSATVPAPPSAVHDQVNDFHNWAQFNPWQELDTNATLSFEGPPSGVGATFHWKGNSNMGAGNMVITGSTPERIDLAMHFLEPMTDSATSAFTFTPDGQGTKVTWSMDGKHSYLSKVVCLFLSMDKMIGGQFEKGLGKLAALPYAPAAPDRFPPMVLSHVFAAPRAQVWAALTEPAKFMKWYAPKDHRCIHADLDVRVNGRYFTSIQVYHGPIIHTTGTYDEVVPLQRLAFTDSFADSTGTLIPLERMAEWEPTEGEQHVTMDLSDAGPDSTLVRVKHEHVPALWTPQCAVTWNAMFDKLAVTLRRTP